MKATPTSTANGIDDLVARARAGDRQALEAVLATVAPAIHRFGLRMCKNAEDADDVLQDALMNVAAHLGEFEGRSSLSSWAFALTRSACARKRRGLKNRPALSDEHLLLTPDPSPNPETRAADSEVAAALSGALDGLSDDYREVILLRDVEGLSAPEVALALGVSVDAVKSRLHRAREALRAALRPLLEPQAQAASSACADVGTLWSKKLEGDLSRSDCASMEEHLATCPACSSACNALKRALLACQRVQTTEVPPGIQARIKAAVRNWAGQSSP